MKILLIDDHSLFAEGLRFLLKDFDQSVEQVWCDSCESALQQPEPEKVELILLDYYLPGISGMSALEKLREYYPNAPITVVSALDDAKDIRQIIDAGASGFISKASTFAVLSAALRLVLAGGTYLPPQVIETSRSDKSNQTGLRIESGGLECLSQRQREVLMQVVQGKPNKVIARTLNISEHTVKAHVTACFKLLGVRNRTEAVYAAAKLSHQDLEDIAGTGGGDAS